jgi:hypothetical protein
LPPTGINTFASAHPGYLSRLHFQGIGFFEWKYEGYQLTEAEINVPY